MNIHTFKKFNKDKSILGFFIIAGIAFLLLSLSSRSQSSVKGANTQKTVQKKEPTPSIRPTVVVETESSVMENTPTVSFQPTSVPTSIPQPTSTPVPQAKTNQIALSINGAASVSVTVSEGATQCDVLQKALEQGKISSLNMRYLDSYNSYAVYQINGIGKENSVWWTYKVNGASPTQGCSFVKANNGDTVAWEYIGS